MKIFTLNGEYEIFISNLLYLLNFYFSTIHNEKFLKTSIFLNLLHLFQMYAIIKVNFFKFRSGIFMKKIVKKYKELSED